jgi:16S rRNA (uracil1498-N3)-methyltransferase
MPRFFAEITSYPLAVIDDMASIRHISGPLRKKMGDEIDIRDELNGYKARISSIEHHRIVLEIITAQDLFDRCEAKLHLAMSLIDIKDMDDTIRFAAELGVSDIYPIISTRSNIRSISDARYKRWQTLVLEAVKQSGRKSIPLVHMTESLEELVHSSSRHWEYRLVAFQGARDSISTYKKTDIGILVGPEGGFTSLESDMILQEGFIPVNLGNTTLRAVTAAITALSVLGL